MSNSLPNFIKIRFVQMRPPFCCRCVVYVRRSNKFASVCCVIDKNMNNPYPLPHH